MKINVQYNSGENGELEMVKLKTGAIFNCGGRSLPF